MTKTKTESTSTNLTINPVEIRSWELGTMTAEEQLTDAGNAYQLVRQFGDQIYFVPAWGWLVWDGRRWKKSDHDEMIRAAIATARYIREAALNIDDHSAALAMSKWGSRSLSEPRLRAMVNLARSIPSIAADPDDFDNDPWLLNVENGTLDLRTEILQNHSPSDMLTKMAGTYYRPDAECPTWLGFLNRIMDGDQDMVNFLKQAVGYSLTGDISEQCLFFMHGSGQNGKSTFINTLEELLGDYSAKTPMNTLRSRNFDAIPNDVARLVGERLVSAAEISNGMYLNESLVKDLTGGDTITARFLRKEFFEFKPTFKIWMYGNQVPIIRGTDNGIWRRINLIPFSVAISGKERDNNLGAKLLRELPGILNWAIQGCIEWQKSGLLLPEKIKDATRTYRNEMDQVSRFLDEKCVLDPNASVTKANLHEVYKSWCEANGELTEKISGFGRLLSKRGFSKNDRSTGGTRIWRGIGLIDNSDESDKEIQ
jgi:putative DNA primase/helicase